MCATTMIPRPDTADLLSRVMSPLHDTWMGEADQTLAPLVRNEATFWDRWAAVNYLRDQFPERARVEQELLTELHAFFTPEINERLRMQIERLTRLHAEVEQVSECRASARQMASAVRELLEALRLWYAEIELAVDAIHRKDLGARAARLLARLDPSMRIERGYPELTLTVGQFCGTCR